MTTSDSGLSVISRISLLVTIISPASFKPGIGGTDDSEPVQIRMFLPIYFSLLQVTSIPSAERPLITASPLITSTLFFFILPSTPRTSLRTTFFLRDNIFP